MIIRKEYTYINGNDVFVMIPLSNGIDFTTDTTCKANLETGKFSQQILTELVNLCKTIKKSTKISDDDKNIIMGKLKRYKAVLVENTDTFFDSYGLYIQLIKSITNKSNLHVSEFAPMSCHTHNLIISNTNERFFKVNTDFALKLRGAIQQNISLFNKDTQNIKTIIEEKLISKNLLSSRELFIEAEKEINKYISGINLVEEVFHHKSFNKHKKIILSQLNISDLVNQAYKEAKFQELFYKEFESFVKEIMTSVDIHSQIQTLMHTNNIVWDMAFNFKNIFLEALSQNDHYINSNMCNYAEERVSLLTQYFIQTIKEELFSLGLIDHTNVFESQILTDELIGLLVREYKKKSPDHFNVIFNWVLSKLDLDKKHHISEFNKNRIFELFRMRWMSFIDLPHFDELAVLSKSSQGSWGTYRTRICVELSSFIKDSKLNHPIDQFIKDQSLGFIEFNKKHTVFKSSKNYSNVERIKEISSILNNYDQLSSSVIQERLIKLDINLQSRTKSNLESYIKKELEKCSSDDLIKLKDVSYVKDYYISSIKKSFNDTLYYLLNPFKSISRLFKYIYKISYLSYQKISFDFKKMYKSINSEFFKSTCKKTEMNQYNDNDVNIRIPPSNIP